MKPSEHFDETVHAVRCEPSGRTVKVPADTTVMDAVDQVMLPLGRSCDGVSLCGFCRVRIIDGEKNLSPVGRSEMEVLKGLGAGSGERLACCARVRGPVTVTTKYW